MTCAVPELLRVIDVGAVRAQLSRRSLSEFVKQSWHVLEPTARLVWNWHLDAICVHVQAVLEGWMDAQATGIPPDDYIQNLLINVPPGSMKSRIICVCAPAWMWLHCPSWRAIFISSNPRVALRDAVYCRDLITSDWYQQTFKPNWGFAEDQNAKGNYRNTAGGFRMAIGVGAKITGERGDALFVDDPHDADEVTSDTIRQGVLDWWDQAACNRVNDLKTSVRIGIMQRLHDEDWAGHVLKTGEWEHLCIPQELVPGHAKLKPVKGDNGTQLEWFDEPTVIGWRDPRVTAGELMCPERFPAEVVDQEKHRLTDSGYSGQHQQDPAAAGGNLFKTAWFRYFASNETEYILKHPSRGELRVPKKLCKRITIGDFAFSTKQTADFTVLGTIDITPEGDALVFDLRRMRMEDPDVEVEVERVWDELHPMYVGIENKQNGATIIQRLARKGRVRVKAIEADTDKLTRSVPAQVDMKNGKYYFPADAKWFPEFKAEVTRFPNASHDDQVDFLSYSAIEKTSAMPRLTDWGKVSTV